MLLGSLRDAELSAPITKPIHSKKKTMAQTEKVYSAIKEIIQMNVEINGSECTEMAWNKTTEVDEHKVYYSGTTNTNMESKS